MQSKYRIYRSIWILVLAFFLTKNISNLIQNYEYLWISAFHNVQYLTSIFTALFTLLLIIEQFLVLTNKLTFKLNFRFLICLTVISTIILGLNIFNIGYLIYLMTLGVKIGNKALISFIIDFAFSLLITVILISFFKGYYKAYKVLKSNHNKINNFKDNDKNDSNNNLVN